jgi:hypothetical protein
MKLRMLTLVATLGLLLLAAVAGGASATEAAAKPGFLPGTWNGIGTISGSLDDGFASTRFSGKLGFHLKVKPDLTVTGSGSRVMTMKGSGPVSSSMTGIAVLKFSGNATDARFSGIENVTGTVTANGIPKPVRINGRAINNLRLVISRGGKCSANGTVPMAPGVTLKWTARLAITGTCNA